MEEYFLDIIYKEKKVRFRIANCESSLSSLMHNLRHAIAADGKLIFDFPSVDNTGAPLDYFFAKEDGVSHELRVMRPKIGHTEQTLANYGIRNGDYVHVIPDPFPG